MKKLLILIITTITMFSCSPQKKDLTIILHTESGYGVFRQGNSILYPKNDSIKYEGIPNDVTEFVIRKRSFQSEQYNWELYKKDKISKERFLKLISKYEIDTTKLSNTPFDHQVSILIGTNQKNKRVIIVDANNDGNFGNEKVLEYEYPLSIAKQKKILDKLPTIPTKYNYYYNDEIITKSVNIRPSPYKGALNIQYSNASPLEKKYDLLISIPEYKKGEIEIENIKYDVFVSNKFTTSVYLKRKTSLYISKQGEKKPSQLNKDIAYQIGDVINSNYEDYLIESISIWGDTIKLKYLGSNTKPKGIKEGFFFPDFEAKKLDNSIFDLNQYSGKYILFDFWGTWCTPCIKAIPDIKQFKSEFKNANFEIVSVAYDTDLSKVTEFTENKNMNWEHIFINQKNQNQNSLVEKLKVRSFPTTILISPEGKIIARNKPINELKKILKSHLNPSD